MQKRYIVALEIASSKIKGAVASMPIASDSADTPITIEAIEEAPTTAAAVQYGRILNITETAKTASQIIQRLEARHIFDPGKIIAVYTSIGGRSLASELISTEIELPEPTDITSEYVDRLKNAARSQVDPNREVLAVIPVKYMVDGTIMANPVGTFGQHLNGAFNIVTSNPINKRNLEMVVEERLRLDICENIVCPLAEAELVLSSDERQIGCVLVDFGAETTTVAIYKNSVLQSISTLPIGSRNITRDISMGVGLTEVRAEQLKCTIGSATEETPGNAPGSEEARVNNYIHARIGEIIANISAQISAAEFSWDDIPGGFVVIGGGARLRNFNTALEAQTKLKVRTGTCGSNFRIVDNTIDHYDNIDILSIVNYAARTSDYVCIEMPYEVATGDPSFVHKTPARVYNDSSEINEDDPMVLIDDEEAKKIKQKKEEKKTHERINEDASLDDETENEKTDGKKHETISLKQRLLDLFFVSDDKDTVLDDDDMDAKK